LGVPGKSVKDWDSLLDNAKQTDGEGTARNLVGRGTFAYFIDQGLAKIQAKKD
jgi:tRNA A-37 threonylcarbamoyl transferase component Bud32